MAIDFPSSPTVGQSFTSGNQQWVWDGTKWVASGVASGLWVRSEERRVGKECW